MSVSTSVAKAITSYLDRSALPLGRPSSACWSLSAGSNRRLAWEELSVLVRFASEAVDDGALGLAVGVATPLRELHVLPSLFLASGTMREAIECFSRYGRLWLSSLAYRIAEEQSTARIEVRTLDLTPSNARFAGEFAISLLARLIRLYVPTALGRLRGISLVEPATAYSPHHRLFFACPLEFDQATYAIDLPCDLLDRSHVHADRCTHEALQQIAERQLGSLPAHEDLVPYLRDALSREHSVSKVDASGYARALGLRPYVLRNELYRQKTSMFRLLDDERRRRAKEGMRAGLSAAEVASRAGYAELSGFYRAFRRWTGLTPAQYAQRAEQCAESS